MENSNIKKSKNNKSFTLNFLIIISIAFFMLSAFLFVKLLNSNKIIEKEVLLKETSISDKDKMILKLRTLEIEYDELSDEYSSLDSLFASEKKKVSELLSEIKTLKGSSETYKSKVSELEHRLREYLDNIDELKERNEALTSQNIVLNKGLDSAINVNYQLSNINQELVSIVEKGSKMKAYDVAADAIRIRSGNKEVGTDNAKRVQKFRICFLLGENAIVEPGQKSIYLRIAQPDGIIISESPDNFFVFENQNITYTLKQDIIYNNKAMDLCLYWNKDRELKKGRYEIFIFLDNQEIGRTAINLE